MSSVMRTGTTSGRSSAFSSTPNHTGTRPLVGDVSDFRLAKPNSQGNCRWRAWHPLGRGFYQLRSGSRSILELRQACDAVMNAAIVRGNYDQIRIFPHQLM